MELALSNGTRYRHGMTGTRTHRIWVGMRRRCRDENASGYQNYGGRGIKVCPEWDSFEQFLSDMGECPSGYSLDRIDGDLGYEPSNCRWATLEDQNNNRRSVVLVEWQGKTLSIRQWSRELSIRHQTLYSRWKAGVRPPELFAPTFSPRVVSLNGENVTVEDAAKQLGVSGNAVRYRDDKGESVSDGLKNSLIVEYLGRSESLHHWSKITGIAYLTLYSRYRSGLRGSDLFKPSSRKTNKPLRKMS